VNHANIGDLFAPELSFGNGFSMSCDFRSNRLETIRPKDALDGRDSEQEEVCILLVAWANGDRKALDQLASIVYTELHALAHKFLKQERKSHTLQTSALVNEAYLRLVDCTRMSCESRSHLLALSAQMMRRVLVDHARGKQKLKRGAGAVHVALEDATITAVERPADLATLDEAISRLSQLDPQKAELVELRYFGGLSVEETAQVLQVSPVTVIRHWNSAKLWLYRYISGSNFDDGA
jgi:RNA polymerase sigma-70 factor, ECF subfamily